MIWGWYKVFFSFSRLSVPLLKMLDLMITNGSFEIFTTQEKWVLKQLCFNNMCGIWARASLKILSLCSKSPVLCGAFGDLQRAQEVQGYRQDSRLPVCVSVHPAAIIHWCETENVIHGDSVVWCFPASAAWFSFRVRWGRRFCPSCWCYSVIPSLWWVNKEYIIIYNRCVKTVSNTFILRICIWFSWIYVVCLYSITVRFGSSDSTEISFYSY